MNESIVTLTVYFEDPFWVGVIEKVENNKLSVCKITFGAEPKDSEIFDFVLHRYYDLKFSPAVEVKRKHSADNPKRRQRNVKKQLQNIGVGTKSQQALALGREVMKQARKKKSKEEREQEKQSLFNLKKQQRKEKHTGHKRIEPIRLSCA